MTDVVYHDRIVFLVCKGGLVAEGGFKLLSIADHILKRLELAGLSEDFCFEDVVVETACKLILNVH